MDGLCQNFAVLYVSERSDSYELRFFSVDLSSLGRKSLDVG